MGVYDGSPLAVQQPPDLREVAVPLDHVVEHGGLHEEGVVAPAHPLHALLVVLDEDAGPLVLHIVPHLLVGRDLGVAEEGHGGAPTQRPVPVITIFSAEF